MAAPDPKLLALSAEQLSAMVNAVTDGITVQAPDGRLLLANDAAADMLGFSSSSALLGVAPAQIMAHFELLDVEGRPLDVGRLPGRAALAGADPPEMLVRFRLRGSGVDRFSQVSARAVRDETGAVAFAVNVFRDVTDRQVAIEELRASEARLAFLASASRRLLTTSLNPRRVLEEVADLVVPELADWCAVREFSDDGRLKRVAVGPPGLRRSPSLGLLDGYRDPFGDGAAVEELASGRSILVSEVTDAMLEQAAVDDDHLELLRQLGVASVMAVPLRSRGRILGALTLATGHQRAPYRQADLDLAEELANRVAATVDNARSYAAEHATAETLARALLPGRLPDIAGLELAARYRAAGLVGGDFYDCFPIGDGTWLLVVGDVCGRGIAAAAMTGLTRHTIRAAALHVTSPAAVLADLNRLLVADADEQTAAWPPNGGAGEPSFCTVCLAALTPTPTGAQVTVSVAGHPLPVVVRSSAEVVEIGRPGSLLGVMPDIELFEETGELGPGDALVLFTDGITERRHGGELFGERELGVTLSSLAGTPAVELTRQIENAAVSYASAPPDDDMAVLTVCVPSPRSSQTRSEPPRSGLPGSTD